MKKVKKSNICWGIITVIILNAVLMAGCTEKNETVSQSVQELTSEKQDQDESTNNSSVESDEPDESATASSGKPEEKSPEELFDEYCSKEYSSAFSEDADATEMLTKEDPVDLDNDGEKEFILRNPVYGDRYYDCKDGKITLLADSYGTADYCSYVTYKDATWIVHSDTTHGGREYYQFDKYDGDLNIVESFNLYWTAEDEEEKNKTYFFNDEEITEEEYNKYYNEIFK
ncbi:hypothetical protein D6856_02980 [Butyrivibrio sp. XB500-5]|uniref:hypothetical protein n=1 Tax=Butyrivibrio sp. XB500-5 TaxID=2364880 RepID=UPI000EAA3BCB|nr:hypothetical protein [Butyrivibrio sp. XB500-5]RKM63101.1 hypothetical protein D6856_02980 [Butyrivibrio sp. XB500-5]